MSVNRAARRVSTVAASCALVLCGLLSVARPVTADVQTAVEYGFSTDSDYCYSREPIIVVPGYCIYDSYFVTTSPAEIAALDAGFFNIRYFPYIGHWSRTGETFNVWSGAENGALPTCRFFNPTFLVEHFYTPYAAECEAVQANVAWNWQYEGTPFYLQLPDEVGRCPTGTTILYRLYWPLPGYPSHRLTTNAATFNQMLAQGWIFEGDTRTFAFACVPSSTALSTP